MARLRERQRLAVGVTIVIGTLALAALVSTVQLHRAAEQPPVAGGMTGSGNPGNPGNAGGAGSPTSTTVLRPSDGARGKPEPAEPSSECHPAAGAAARDVPLDPGTDLGLKGLAAQAFDKIVVGKIAFNRPDSMRVGNVARMQVRIAKTATCDLVRNFVGPGEVQLKDVEVSTLLRVALIGEDFHIEALSTQDQPVLDRGFTQWDWNVTPEASGVHYLYVRVTLRLKIPNSGTEFLDRTVLTEPIRVAVNPLYSAKRFASANWQWAVGGLTPTAAVIGLWGLIRTRRLKANAAASQASEPTDASPSLQAAVQPSVQRKDHERGS